MKQKSDASDPKLPIGTNYCKCSACGQYFGSVTGFDKHRIGSGDERKCLTPTELSERGMVTDAAGRWRLPMRGAWPLARRS